MGLWVVDGFRLPLSDEEQDPSAADLEAFAVACSAEHLVLLRALDVTHLVVAVSRQDEARWDERRFNRLRQVLLRCTRVFGGFPSSNVSFVPVAALPGVNLIPQTRAEEQSRKLAAAAEARQSAKSESGLEQLIRLQEQQREQHRLMSKWWTGPSLLEAIEKLPVSAFFAHAKMLLLLPALAAQAHLPTCCLVFRMKPLSVAVFKEGQTPLKRRSPHASPTPSALAELPAESKMRSRAFA